MFRIKKNADLSFTAQQMYDLVNDVGSYPEFLPWCRDARILFADGERMEARLTLAAGGLRHSLTTRNELKNGEHIRIALVDGPFRNLSGDWHFRDAADGACVVDLEMEFEFKNRLLRRALEPVFSRVVHSLIDSFRRRAVALYGR